MPDLTYSTFDIQIPVFAEPDTLAAFDRLQQGSSNAVLTTAENDYFCTFRTKLPHIGTVVPPPLARRNELIQHENVASGPVERRFVMLRDSEGQKAKAGQGERPPQDLNGHHCRHGRKCDPSNARYVPLLSAGCPQAPANALCYRYLPP
jgi:hypothetical protein